MPTLVAFFCLVIGSAVMSSHDSQSTSSPSVIPRSESPVPARDPRAAQHTGSARVRGCIRDEQGQSLPGAMITTVAPELRQRRSIVTGPDGCYEFTALQPGTYQLAASKAGYVRAIYGQHDDDVMRGEKIQLQADQTRDHADMTLRRGGVIYGHVYDGAGRPMTDVSVAAFQLGEGSATVVPQSGHAVQTDDLGQFRLFGLMPGEYCVLVRPKASMDSTHVGTKGVGYTATFAPSVLTLAEAAHILVSAGQEVATDVQLTPTKLFTLSGAAVTSTGIPLNGTVRLLTPDGRSIAEGGASPREGGHFSLDGVPAGSYTLSVRGSAAAAPGGAGRPLEFAAVPAIVADGDLEGLTVVTSSGASIPGELVFEGGSTPSDLTMARIVARASGPDNAMIHVRMATVDKDGHFTLETPPGESLVDITNLPDGWMLKSMIYRGMDITSKPFAFTTEADRLRIVLTNHVTVLTGTITDDAGHMLTNARVTLIPAERTARSAIGDTGVRVLKTNREGIFTAKGLLPGTYLLAAFDSDGDRAARSDLLERARSGAQRVTLAEGETKSVTVTASK